MGFILGYGLGSGGVGNGLAALAESCRQHPGSCEMAWWEPYLYFGGLGLIALMFLVPLVIIPVCDWWADRNAPPGSPGYYRRQAGVSSYGMSKGGAPSVPYHKLPEWKP